MTIGRMTGKELALPEVSRRWPAVDRTASPDAQPSDRRLAALKVLLEATTVARKTAKRCRSDSWE
jgi:hypothetical protein